MATAKAQRATAQRALVQNALVELAGFHSAQDVYAALRSSGHNVGLSTVYRHLQSFAGQHLADVIHTADGEATYRYCGPAAEGKHHHHLVCRDCGQAEEIEGRGVERWADKIAAEHGYTEVEHTVEIFGRCADCAAG